MLRQDRQDGRPLLLIVDRVGVVEDAIAVVVHCLYVSLHNVQSHDEKVSLPQAAWRTRAHLGSTTESPASGVR